MTWGPSLLQYEVCISAGHWGIDGFIVIRDNTGRHWHIYGPCDEFGQTHTLAEAREMIRRGEVPL